MLCAYTSILLSAAAQQVAGSEESLGSQDVGYALNGLKCMNCDCVEVRHLLQVLSIKVRDCSEELQPQDIGRH